MNKQNYKKYIIYVAFIVAGIITIISTVMSAVSSIRKNESVTDIIISSIFILIFGIVFVLIGAFPLKWMFQKDARNKELVEQGNYVSAIVDRIDINHRRSSNGKHPFIIHCKYQNEYTGVIYEFESEDLWENPAPYIHQGTKLRVYVNDHNYSEYYVDIDSAM